MARYLFGGGIADWVFDALTIGTDDNIPQTQGSETVTFYNGSDPGATQYVDLLDLNLDPISSVTSSDGLDGRDHGQVPPFWGPDGVGEMWAQAGPSGARVLVTAAMGSQVVALLDDVAALDSQLTAHLSASNPHAMATVHLTDVDSATPLDGQVLVWEQSVEKYVPTTVSGLTGFVSTSGGSEITIPSGDITTKALVINIPPGDRATAVNTVEVWWNAGTEGSPNMQLVTRLNEYGELRLQPSHTARVPLRVKQFNGSQTGRLTEWTDFSNNALAWVDSVGRMRAPNIGITPVWTQETGVGGTGTYRWYNTTGTALILRGFAVSAGGTAPGGTGEYVIEPKLDGVALYSSVDRPKLVVGSRYSGVAANLITTVWPAGSYLTVDVLSVTSTPPTKITIQALAY